MGHIHEHSRKINNLMYFGGHGTSIDFKYKLQINDTARKYQNHNWKYSDN